MFNADDIEDVALIDKSEINSYIELFLKEKKSDKLLLCSRIYDLSDYLHLLNIQELDELKCIANTLKLYDSKSFFKNKIDNEIVKLLKQDIHLFVVLRILFLASVAPNDNILTYGPFVVFKLFDILKTKNPELEEEALKCLYNYLNFYSLVPVNDESKDALINAKFPVNELFLLIRQLVLDPNHTSSALNCLVQFKEYIASQVNGVKKSIQEPIKLINGITVEFKDKELVDYLINYLDTHFTHTNEETGTVFGIIAYLFSWMCQLSFPVANKSSDFIKPWQLYLKHQLLPDTVDRSVILGAGTSLAHRIVSSFSATATLGLDKVEVDAIMEGQIRPPPMSAFTSERMQELVFYLFDEHGNFNNGWLLM